MGPDNNRHGASEEVPWCRVTLKYRKDCGSFTIANKVQLKTSSSERLLRPLVTVVIDLTSVRLREVVSTSTETSKTLILQAH